MKNGNIINGNIINGNIILESTQIPEKIPLPEEVFTLNKVFKDNGYDLKVVGGAVRDYLMWKNSDQKKPYSPKDIDLATDAKPREIESILNKANIRNFEKGEAFGVWVAHINGEDYEIATFRRDIGGSDGRRPDSVEFTKDPAEDHSRRDLTINGLYYDIPANPNARGKVIDYTKGQALKDIEDKKVRFIGSAHDRIKEDKLRVPRAVRFHSRYNDNDVLNNMDQDTLSAIQKFKDLRSHGISSERIQQEFVNGLGKAKNVVSYLKNYDKLDLLDSVFPSLDIDMSMAERLKGVHDPVLVLASLLINNDAQKVRKVLNKLTWSNHINDEVAFLIELYHKGSLSAHDSALINKSVSRRNYVKNFAKVLGDKVDQKAWRHFGDYEVLSPDKTKSVSGDRVMNKYNASGKAVGDKLKQIQQKAFDLSFKNFLKDNG